MELVWSYVYLILPWDGICKRLLKCFSAWYVCWICVWYRENYLVYQYDTNAQFSESYTVILLMSWQSGNSQMHRYQLRLSLKQNDGFLEIATESNIRNFGRKADTSLLTPDLFLLCTELLCFSVVTSRWIAHKVLGILVNTVSKEHGTNNLMYFRILVFS
jgi:hypothetical protein